MYTKIKSRIAVAKVTFNKKKTIFTCRLDLNLRKKFVKCYIWNIPLCGAETSTLRKDQKYLKSFDMCCWRRLAISWTDRVKNEVLQIVKEERDIQ
jgi:hypothetical protein